MRLVSPSCGAEYEVDDSVIPEAGRDVQCSNCGQAWFQASAAQQRAEEAAANVTDDSQDWTEDEGEADESEEVTPPPADASDTAVSEQPDAAQEDTAPPADADTAQEAQEPTPELPSFKRRTLDDAVLNVLREEAARTLLQSAILSGVKMPARHRFPPMARCSRSAAPCCQAASSV